MTAIVVDASLSAVWLLDDESNERSEAVLTALESQTGIVPKLWHFEVCNLLLMASRRGRLTAPAAAHRIDQLASFNLETDDAPDRQAIFALAGKHRLTFYDAVYLELAIRRGASLSTLDRALLAAAQAEGVAWA